MKWQVVGRALVFQNQRKPVHDSIRVLCMRSLFAYRRLGSQRVGCVHSVACVSPPNPLQCAFHATDVYSHVVSNFSVCLTGHDQTSDFAFGGVVEPLEHALSPVSRLGCHVRIKLSRQPIDGKSVATARAAFLTEFALAKIGCIVPGNRRQNPPKVVAILELGETSPSVAPEQKA